MDRTALRVERIRQDLDGKRFAIDLLARIHIALLAVSFTVIASAAIADFTGRLGTFQTSSIAMAAGAILALQVRALLELTRQWTIARSDAARATDSLIASQGEEPHDGGEAPPA